MLKTSDNWPAKFRVRYRNGRTAVKPSLRVACELYYGYINRYRAVYWLNANRRWQRVYQIHDSYLGGVIYFEPGGGLPPMWVQDPGDKMPVGRLLT